MTETLLPLEEVKEKLEALVARVEAGEAIVITRDGRPVARLSPISTQKPIAYGDLAYLAPSLPDDLSLPQEVLDDFETSIENTARQLETGKFE